MNKILIVSIDGDNSTDKVIDWINHLGSSTYRHNVNTDFFENDFLISLELDSNKSKINLRLEKEKINLEEINCVWFRKYSFPIFKNKISEISDDLNNHLKKEFTAGNFACYKILMGNKKILGETIINQPSKFDMLFKAQEYNIDIPNTLITNKKSELISFFDKNKQIITKSIKSGEMFSKRDHNNKIISATIYTEIVNEYFINETPDFFLLSLFQEKIEKEIEIRSFYLDGSFYSSAIFSQLDKQTDVDFRMYNDRRPNRIIPYQLPKKLEIKLKKLMQSLNLKSGSFDIIKTKNNKFIFLEVNPWGQYGMISNPCNFNLDKKIAEYLIN